MSQSETQKYFFPFDFIKNDAVDYYRFIADDIRSFEATSFAYKIISASITDMWAF